MHKLCLLDSTASSVWLVGLLARGRGRREARVQVLWAHVGQGTPWGLLWEEDPVDRSTAALSENFPSDNRAMGGLQSSEKQCRLSDNVKKV